jgi:prepilin-type N-terminal cleavage/methylation domain-containing protein
MNILHRPTDNPVGGFTLIELLVVVAILTLLISILLPSLSHAKDMAKEVQCLTNQRTIGMALAMYADECKSRLPSSETWLDAALPRLRYTQPASSLKCSRRNMPSVLFCPVDKDPYPKPYMTGEMEVTSYFVNGAATDFAMGGGKTLGIGLFGGGCRVDKVRTPSVCMMIGETTNYGKVVDLDHPAVQAAFTTARSAISDARTRFHHRATSGFYHHGRMGIQYVDGHSSSLRGKRVAPLAPSLWPGGALMTAGFTFYPSLSLPTATENPQFWGPLYTEWKGTAHE